MAALPLVCISFGTADSDGQRLMRCSIHCAAGERFCVFIVTLLKRTVERTRKRAACSTSCTEQCNSRSSSTMRSSRRGQRAMYRMLRERAEKASQLRGSFTKQHVHPSCDDAGHQHQLRMYTQLADHFREQWEQLRFQPKPPPHLSADHKALAAHRAYLAECEVHKVKLAENAITLKAQWKALRADKERAAREESKQREADGKVAINEALLSNQRQVIAHIKTRRGDDWIIDIYRALQSFISMYRRSADPEWEVGEWADELEDDMDDTCLLLPEFCAFFFGESIDSYSEALHYQLGGFCLRMSEETLVKAREVCKQAKQDGRHFSLPATALSMIAGVIVLGDEADEQRALERAREIASDDDIAERWPSDRLTLVTGANRRDRQPLYAYFYGLVAASFMRGPPANRQRLLAYPGSTLRVGRAVVTKMPRG